MNYFKNRFGIFLDELRKARNIPRAEFINGICSYRQYLRYLSGNFYIPNEKIIPFAEKLKINVVELFEMYEDIYNKENKKINKITTLLTQYNFQDAYEQIKRIDIDSMISKINIDQYKIAKTVAEYRLDIITKDTAINSINKIIDYENCIKKERLNSVELNGLIYIAILDSSNEIKESTIDLYNKLIKLDSDAIEIKKIVPLCTNTAQLLLSIEEVDKALEVAKLGIKFCIDTMTYKSNSLANLYYYAAFAELKRDNKDKALHYAKKTFHALSIENNESRFNFFKNHFTKTFKMDFTNIYIE